MKRIEAFQSDDGRLHSSPHDAAVADFMIAVKNIWGKLPRSDVTYRGDPYEIANLLSAPGAAEARAELMAALERFEKAEAAC